MFEQIAKAASEYLSDAKKLRETLSAKHHRLGESLLTLYIEAMESDDPVLYDANRFKAMEDINEARNLLASEGHAFLTPAEVAELKTAIELVSKAFQV